jgi:hypothetical protein
MPERQKRPNIEAKERSDIELMRPANTLASKKLGRAREQGSGMPVLVSLINSTLGLFCLCIRSLLTLLRTSATRSSRPRRRRWQERLRF